MCDANGIVAWGLTLRSPKESIFVSTTKNNTDIAAENVLSMIENIRYICD